VVTGQFLATFTPDGGARIQLQRTVRGKGFFQKDRVEAVETARWPSVDATGVAVSLLDLAARGDAIDDGSGLALPPATVAKLAEPVAMASGLPPAAPIVLSLRGKGLIVQDDFEVELRWARSNGSGIAVDVCGARVRLNGTDYRLPEPLYSLHKAALDINAAEAGSARQAAFAELRQKLDQHADQAILDGLLTETRIAFAGNFSLSLDGSQFDPVLFGPRIGEAAEAGDTIDETADNLLTAEQQSAFARQFRARRGKSRSYLLQDGTILFLDPVLATALAVVGEKQSAPEAQRQQFASSPRRAIAEALGSAPEQLERLFIETAQYSERVIGIDPWRKPVLPWIKPKPNTWLPEIFGIAVGDPPVRIEVPPEALKSALEQVEAAIAAGQQSVRIAGADVPASPATAAALKDLIALLPYGQPGEDLPAPPPELATKMFLQVRENLDAVSYAPLARVDVAAAPPPVLPSGVKTILKPHQVEGFQWLASAWRTQRPGLLLADDMGLGKTLQALTFFCWLREQGVRSPMLVVAPTGLLANWQAEIERHLVSGALGPVFRAYGNALRAHRDGNGTDTDVGAARLNTSDWNEAGVILTTYETMRDYHFSMARVEFAVIAYDEAQRLKNPAAQITRAAKTLRTRLSIALTGTPVENRLQDLWSISDVVQPSLLGASKAFEERYGQAETDVLRELNARLTTAASPWPPFMIRRMKADHVEGLPAKVEVNRPVIMPPLQAKAYMQAVQRAQLLKGSGSREAVLETLARLRAISLAPELPRVGPDFAIHSARLQACMAILEEVKARAEKALIFCESLDLQPLLAAELRRRYGLARSVPCISGQVAGEVRQQLVDDFQSRPPGFDVMILSPRAGGVGLTITAANHVIHLTRWWNPAVEDQATDRAYRIGQTKDVTVWVPIAEHPDPALRSSSFDQSLAALLRRKRSLAQGLLIEPEGQSDAADLFASVVAGSPDVPTEQVPPEPECAEPAVIKPPQPPADPPPTALPSEAGQYKPVRYEKTAGQDIPWPLFTECLANKAVKRVDIIDPYAAAGPRNCKLLVEFLAGLRERDVSFQNLTLECWDALSVDREFSDCAAQSRFLANAIVGAGLGDVRFYPTFRSHRGGTQMHDRKIVATFEDGTTVTWDIGGGIDYLMGKRYGTTIWRWFNLSNGI
jgi:hypothetical protein